HTVTGSSGFKTDEASSGKFTAPLLDTPKSVTVIPAEVLQDTGSVTLTEALRTVPGIAFGAGEGGNPVGDRSFIRGYDAQAS
ncbi:TonB-dependent receptor plug domain-containing protein, partial [Pandoraea pneumonica]|uniref:TonB-dependent receptor plug domain-containing protein n=2 Tax=Burkholderiaceae TaxID=119060 RepID=UPI003CF83269